MAPEQNNGDREKQKNLDQEVREMISSLTSRLGGIQRSQKSGSSSSHSHSHGLEEEEEQGVRIITLAGSNVGATMRGEVDEKKSAGPQVQPEQEESASPSSYVVNSNFQAINNSIMLGGSYKTNDPGVHLDVTDYLDHNDVKLQAQGGRKARRGGAHHHHAKRSDNLSDSDSHDNN